MTANGRGEEVEEDETYLLLEEFYRGRLRWFYKRTLIAFGIVFFSFAATGFYVYTTTESNRKSLCTLRHDAEVRVAEAEKFLKENPEGIPGISPSVIQRGLDNSKQTIQSLSNLSCDDLQPAVATPTDGAN